MSAFCKSKGIKLLFFQSPFREGIYKHLKKEKVEALHAYQDHIAGILKRDNHLFINTHKILWNDSLFIDSEHMHEKGARLFTEYCLDQIQLRN
jgi:hypothetical protein